MSAAITELMLKHKSAEHLVYGDFNELDTDFLENTFNMKQLITFSTRDDAALYLVLTNSQEYQSSDIQKSVPLSTNDHCSVLIGSPIINTLVGYWVCPFSSWC